MLSSFPSWAEQPEAVHLGPFETEGPAVYLVPRPLETGWECQVRELLEACQPFGEVWRLEVEADPILEQIARGALELLAIDSEECHALALIEAHPGDTLLVHALAGEGLHTWVRGLDEVLEWLARRVGCRYIGMRGRPGWRHSLAMLGYRTETIYMHREV